MPRSYLPPHYSTLGIQMMGCMFEQQVRIAQALGAAAMASNPLLTRPAPFTDDAGETPPKGAAPVRRSKVSSTPPAASTIAPRTHAMPV